MNFAQEMLYGGDSSGALMPRVVLAVMAMSGEGEIAGR